VSGDIVLAVDGGNSKTDLALVRADGEALALVRGPQSSPHHLGLEGCVAVLEDLLERALAEAGIRNGRRPVASLGTLLLAGVDFPTEELEVGRAATQRRLASRISVGNDTLAILRAGTEKGWGVAVVCGAGINCVGVASDGRRTGFPALGEITGDWGGGFDVGLAGVSAAARSQDGRGPSTSLEYAVPAHFGLTTPSELAEAIHRGQIEMSRVMELAPVVLDESGRDGVAASIVAHLSDEVVALVRVALQRLDLVDSPVEVLLGGGLMQSGDRRLIEGVRSGLREIAPAATVHVTRSPPVVGAALFGLDELAAGVEAQDRLRRELGVLVARVEDEGRQRA